MNTIHHHSEEGIECQYRVGFRAGSFICDPPAGFGIMSDVASVAFMVTKRETQFPCKICPQVKWIISAIRLHDQPVFSVRVIFPQREIVVKKILILILDHLMECRPGSLFIVALKQSVNPGRVYFFHTAVPAPEGLPYNTNWGIPVSYTHLRAH